MQNPVANVKFVDIFWLTLLYILSALTNTTRTRAMSVIRIVFTCVYHLVCIAFESGASSSMFIGSTACGTCLPMAALPARCRPHQWTYTCVLSS